MASKKKLLQAAAGAAGGAGLDVDEVFSTYLYTGTGSTQTITNGIDLDGEGGLVWIKSRTDAYNHYLHDTTTSEPWHFLQSNLADARNTNVGNQDLTISAFNSNGFVLGSSSGINNGWGGNNSDFASWTFRKAPKFFDVVTYTGDGTNGRQISHNLGHNVGMAIIKKTSASGDWWVWHRSATNNSMGILNGANAFTTSSINSEFPSEVFGDGNFDQDPTSTFFEVSSFASNENGVSYVAYLFAHNDGDGEFGPDADQDIIKCGSYTGTGSSGHLIDLGFEPQWLLIKNTDAAESWIIQDNMRSMTDTDYAWLYANGSNNEAEGSLSGGASAARPTGFEINLTGANINASGNTYIYMAIRRGPLAAPEDATDVFESYTASPSDADYPAFVSGFVTDAAMRLYKDGGIAHWMSSRLQGEKYLETSNTAAEQATSSAKWDYQTGWYDALGNTSFLSHMWKRAPSYFDVVAYTGTGSARTVSHNLGVAPEMMWFFPRSNGNIKTVYHSALGEGKRLKLNDTTAAEDDTASFNNTAPTSSVFSIGTLGQINGSGRTYIAYLFATVAGVSKVGSVSHSFNSTTNVDCGFSSGARFVLVKSTASGEWRIWDSVRGIVAGNDPYFHLNDTSAQITNGDLIDPYSGGFALSPSFYTDTYIFYAIA